MSVIESTKEQLTSNSAWSIDAAHSTIEFRVKHMVIQTVSGRFRDFEGTLVTGDDPLIVGRINVASLETMHDGRDEHLRSTDFFDVERFPEITFEAGALEFNGTGDHFMLPGKLTIKSVARPITLDGEVVGIVVDADGRDRIALSLRGRIDRGEFGLTWNRLLETGSLVVGDSVDLNLDIAAVRV